MSQRKNMIQADRKHRIENKKGAWTIYRMGANGYEPATTWTGDRRSVFKKLEEMGVEISIDAEEELRAAPEQRTFMGDNERK